MTAICRAHTNIALIKYWGKKDTQLFLPMNSSLSLTLAAFYTDTRVFFEPTAAGDTFILNGQLQNEQATATVSRFIDLFRRETGDRTPVCVTSLNHVPTAAGLASSASAFAALAGSLAQLYRMSLSPLELSRYARQGSGSATRSVYGGFVMWQAGHDHHSSHAVPIDAADWGVAMIIITVNAQSKSISSREGMRRTVATSPFYDMWVQTAEQDIVAIRHAIAQRDLNAVGQIAEHNAMKMHATMLAAQPPFTYFEAQSVTAIHAVQKLREQGYCCYVTMDAGPNVKVLCPKDQQQALYQQLATLFGASSLVCSDVGPGIQKLSEADWQASVVEWRQQQQN